MIKTGPLISRYIFTCNTKALFYIKILDSKFYIHNFLYTTSRAIPPERITLKTVTSYQYSSITHYISLFPRFPASLFAYMPISLLPYSPLSCLHTLLLLRAISVGPLGGRQGCHCQPPLSPPDANAAAEKSAPRPSWNKTSPQQSSTWASPSKQSK